ncbi:uncharacterized protein [Haliotis cracherodii]|uniref:uncharacterized protein n=1 Tax=Haliotis cracherodii TaxID=6455 RepID=UPI0039EC714B
MPPAGTSLTMARFSFIIVILMCFHVDEAPAAVLTNVDTRCNVDNGIVADMSNCGNFIVCLQGRARRVITCSKGLLYDTKLRMCNHKYKVDCGRRPPSADAKVNCFLSDIKVTIKVENQVKPPYFTFRTTVEAPRQPLENFLLMAAGRDSRFRFESKMIDDFGMYVTAINGVRADPLDVTAWLPFDRLNRQLTINIRDYVPQDMETIVFRFYSFAEPDDCSGSGCRTPRARLVGNG